MKTLLEHAEKDLGISAACIESLLLGEYETPEARIRCMTAAVLFARGLADLEHLKRAWSK